MFKLPRSSGKIKQRPYFKGRWYFLIVSESIQWNADFVRPWASKGTSSRCTNRFDKRYIESTRRPSWNGGIGTYVKSEGEYHADAGE